VTEDGPLFDDEDDDSPESDSEAFSFSDFTPKHTDPDGEAAFPPPADVIDVHCIHCGKTFVSSDMVKRWIDSTAEYAWCCPDEECDGVGFCFDIWPVDPDWRDEHGDPVTTDALPANFPEKRENCVWLESDEEIMFEDEYRVGGYERQKQIDTREDAFWPPGTSPRSDDAEGGPMGTDDIPF
jgi:hypothetical protein